MVRWISRYCIVGLLGVTAFLPVTAHGSWKFMVFGDSRGTSSTTPINTNVLRALAEATTNEHASFVLVPGDLVYSGSASSFAQWTNIMAPVYRAGIPVYPVMGNHDADDATAFTNLFGPGIPDNGPAGETDRTYWFVHENALVVNLDEYVTPNRVNQAWLDRVLASNIMPHVFVQGHLPAFKVDHADCLDDYPTNRDTFWNSLSSAGARAYFCGHDHFYDHARLDDGDGNESNDVHQFIVGTAGAPLYPDGTYDGDNGSWTPQRVTHDMTNGYLLVEVDDLNVTYTWKRRAPGGEFVVERANNDFDADRITDIGIFRPSTMTWYVFQSTAGPMNPFQFGIQGDLPVPGDYDGDGYCDVAIFRPSTVTWYVFGSKVGPMAPFQFGAYGDMPAPADYDGDGRTDLAICRPSTMTWYVFGSSDGPLAPFVFGAPGDIPVPADYDGDGKADLAVFRPSTATWYRFGGFAGPMPALQFGAFGDLPMPGDYDGDGQVDVAIFRSSTATWYIFGTSAGPFAPFQFGTFGDRPLRPFQ